MVSITNFVNSFLFKWTWFSLKRKTIRLWDFHNVDCGTLILGMSEHLKNLRTPHMCVQLQEMVSIWLHSFWIVEPLHVGMYVCYWDAHWCCQRSLCMLACMYATATHTDVVGGASACWHVCMLLRRTRMLSEEPLHVGMYVCYCDAHWCCWRSLCMLACMYATASHTDVVVGTYPR